MKQIGFTLIELLTVIAIIAILAAVVFPVAMRAKDSAYRSGDMSHMNSLRTALQLYRVDQGAYPPALFYVAPYDAAAPVLPANQVKSFLYPRRVESLDTFKPAYDRVSPSLITTAVWPNNTSLPAPPGDPQVDLNGDGVLTAADDDACARQAYGPSTVVTSTRKENNPADPPLSYYKISGYDVAQVPNPDGSIRNEIHYALFWTGWGLGTTAPACGGPPGGKVTDDPRQLGYSNPPDTTVVTWNSFFRDYDGFVPQRQKRDIVLFLGGGAKSYDSREVSDRSWRLRP
jgi:prepilin-type N-terminal cleavage/methylation domain-containing protein